MFPQPTWALTKFVKHVTDPLVDKGCNLHLKFGKGGPQKEEFIQGTTTLKTSTKAADKEKVQWPPPKEKQIPLEMGTGGGGGGRRGGSGGKRPPEDKSELEGYLKDDDDDDDDMSTETSFELEVAPEQLASINPNRPILRLKLSPRK